jgi:hypothetical protein
MHSICELTAVSEHDDPMVGIKETKEPPDVILGEAAGTAARRDYRPIERVGTALKESYRDLCDARPIASAPVAAAWSR